MAEATNGAREFSPVWRLAQAVSVASAVTVVALLAVRPDWGLFVTWYVLIPAVPALLLVAPQVWRNLCPISVVHQLPVLAGRGGTNRLTERAQRWAAAAAAAGLFLIVPLRLSIFNENGPAVAAFVLAVLVVSLVGGLLFAGKSGWCSTFCPVGPVEKLYGQQPMVEPPHAHCASCVGCTDACFDRDGRSAVLRLVDAKREAGPGRERSTRGLLRSPTGVFAGAFPGFVLGYFTAPAAAGIGAIYLHIGLFAGASLALFSVVQWGVRLSARFWLLTAAAAAAGLYYWFTVPAVIQATEATVGVGPVAGWTEAVGRGVLLALVGVWLLDAARRDRSGSVHGSASPEVAAL